MTQAALVLLGTAGDIVCWLPEQTTNAGPILIRE